MFKISNKDTRATPDDFSVGVFIDNFEHIHGIVQIIYLLCFFITLSMNSPDVSKVFHLKSRSTV